MFSTATYGLVILGTCRNGIETKSGGKATPAPFFLAMQSLSTLTTLHYLQMCDPRALRAKPAPSGFEVTIVTPPAAELNRHMYRTVGKPWQWTDRLPWTGEEWNRYVNRPELETCIGRFQGETAGYFELETQDEGNVEIAYFGLLPEFIGRGLGGPLLTAAAERAWQMPQTRRVWVHTCSKDHENALDTYRERGFTVFKTERV